jgi:hypothetical protein
MIRPRDLRSNDKMQKRKPRVTVKILVEGDQPATARGRESREIRVGPISAARITRGAPAFQPFIKSRRFAKHSDAGLGQPDFQRLPGTGAIEGAGSDNARVGQVAEQGERRDSAEGHLFARLLLPVAKRAPMVDVIRHAERQPNAGVKQVGRAWPRPRSLPYAPCPHARMPRSEHRAAGSQPEAAHAGDAVLRQRKRRIAVRGR